MRLINPPTRPLQRSAVCDASVTVGDLVRVRGPAIGNKLDVALYTPDAPPGPPNPAVGVVVSKSTTTRCRVVLWGVITGIYTGMTPGVYQFSSSAGRCTGTPPVPMGSQTAWVMPVGVALTDRDLFVNPQMPTLRRGPDA